MNTFNLYTPNEVGTLAVNLLEGVTPLADLVRRFGPNDFREGRGKTVYLNVPGALVAHGRALDDTTTAIVLDSLRERQEPATLDVHAYSAVALSEYDMTLGLQDFTRQVLVPQVDAVADKIENSIAAVLADIAPTPAIAYDATNPVGLFTAGRRALRAKGIDVAAADLVAIVGSSVVDDLLESGALDYDKTGAADALREGSLGRLRGFRCVESGRIEDDEVIFMTSDALYLAERAPAVPLGASFGETVTKNSHSLRYLRDYDVTHTQDRSLVSTFAGAGILPLYHVERTADSGKQGDANFVRGTVDVAEVVGGAVVKVDTAA